MSAVSAFSRARPPATVLLVADGGRSAPPRPGVRLISPRAAADLPQPDAAVGTVRAAIYSGVLTLETAGRIVGAPPAGIFAPDAAHGLRLQALAALLDAIGASSDPPAAARWLSASHPRLRGLTARGMLAARQEALWILLDVIRREHVG